MKSNGWMLGGALVLCFGIGVRAQEQPSDPPAEPGVAGVTEAAEPTPESKSRWKNFFGDKNALYLEVGFAGGSFDAIDASIDTTSAHRAESNLDIDSVLGGRAVIGWRLPSERGRYVVSFEGFKEDSYQFESVGLRNQLSIPPFGFRQVNDLMPWWTVRASDSGVVEGAQSPPIWTDANGNNDVDPGEVAYGDPTLAYSSATTESLKNTTQTWDLLYQREWGGRRFRGAWNAGVRYFLYEGTIPLAAWLGTQSPDLGSQFTDGTIVRLLPLSQKTEGWGPTGSGEAQYNFARGRVTIYLQGRVAFLLQDMTADSGPFFTFAYDGTLGTILAPARLEENLDKSIWHLTGELGTRIRILPGTHLLLAYAYRGYLDAVLVPVEMQIPGTDAQAGKETIALFKAMDIKIPSYHAGLSFQF